MEALMTAREVAELLNVRPKRVYELGIPCVRISPRSKRWDRTTVEAWIALRAGANESWSTLSRV